MKIVLDSNIFVSSYFWYGNPRMVFNRLIDGLDTLFITDDIVNEIGGTVRKPKFDATTEQINELMAGIKDLGKMVTVSPRHRVSGVCRHTVDEKYIECALAANADYIITGDKHLLELKEYGGVKIVSPKEYLEITKS